MRYLADLHIHSHFSRATSPQADLLHLAASGMRKGLTVLGTGDCIHPGWRVAMRSDLVRAEPGLYRLRPDLEAAAEALVPPACRRPLRFLVTGEVSTIYRWDGRTRKVHHVLHALDLDAADRMAAALARIGNITSDGRPILGLDSRDLLEIVLESDPGSFLVPAHAWTPWFSVLGSKSGFDSVDACYRDLASHVFALETGLSSDPEMNRRVSGLDRFRLVSSSDAHSPGKVGREAVALDTPMDGFALRAALETGRGYLGTVEFFPEEGKYHLDGHRACGVRLEPAETRALGGLCPVCGKPVTEGVLHRVEDLADRTVAGRPPTAGFASSHVPLPEVLSEVHGSGEGSLAVEAARAHLLATLGPEFHVLEEAPLEDVSREGGSLLAEAVRRLRAGQVIREAGYDGAYGRIRLFEEDEIRARAGLLFDLPAPVREARRARTKRKDRSAPGGALSDPQGGRDGPTPGQVAVPHRQTRLGSILDGLDPEQRQAAEATGGPLLVVAGPGSGKTRALVHRLAFLVGERGVPAERCLAVTFTRRAAAEVADRLDGLLGPASGRVRICTLHALALEILRDRPATVGLPDGFRVLGGSEPQAEGAVTLDALPGLAVRVLEEDASARADWSARFDHVLVDEYQDIDPDQERLLDLLVRPGTELCAIGDPDQAIYGFRGADVGLFQAFPDRRPGTRIVRLTRNYRSARSIVEAASAVMGGRDAVPLAPGGLPVVLHEAPTDRAEAEAVVHAIERLVGGHTFFSLDSGRSGQESQDHAFGDFAVLYRVDALAGPLVEALGRSGIPFRRRSHEPLLDRPGVRAVVEALCSLEVHGPLRVEDLKTAAERMNRTRQRGSGASRDPVVLQEALDLLAPLAEGRNLEAFLSVLATATPQDAWDPRADVVSLLTLHAAKGLEFRVVFVLGCEEQILPFSFAGPPEADAVDEERRLLYVGMTRARERLVLSRAATRAWRGRVRDMAPSRFLHAIPERLVERVAVGGPLRPRPSGKQISLFG
ncbi:MAG: UvrD-helicase domain-containing protein [Deltaproteobacteria bacterium]|nr:UvrD-helicase domain-containing protein [Deltaproteobacteria bacterium]